jgi:hypothetical protein
MYFSSQLETAPHLISNGDYTYGTIESVRYQNILFLIIINTNHYFFSSEKYWFLNFF